MNLITTIELAAVVTSAIYGILRAARKGLDVVGVTTMAFCVAFGGGTLRDLLLDRHPIFWIANARLSLIVFGLAMVGAAMPRWLAPLERFLWIPDAFGLGLFCVLGASYARECHTPPFVAALLGVVTGTFGGVIADVMCNEIPSLFGRTPLYAICAFAGAWSYLGLDYLGAAPAVALSSGFTVALALRVIAVRWNVSVPPRGLPHEEDRRQT